MTDINEINVHYVEQPFQTTVCKTVKLEGVGLHSGRFVRMAICAAPANHGIKFRRVDVHNRQQLVVARSKYVDQARLCTRIVNHDGVGLETIEHLMAAFSGVGLDNAVIEIDAPEVPILDGSSQPIVEALNKVGLETLPAKRKLMLLTKPVEVSLSSGARAKLVPAEELQIDVKISFEDSAIGNQKYRYEHRNGSFISELACARTFCQLRDIESIKNAGRATGGSLNNAIVVDNGKILNEGGLRVEVEFARHKALDCLGDLFLLGMPIKAHLTALLPGHALSTKLCKTLLNDPTAYKIIEAGAGSSHPESFTMPEFAAAAMA